MNQVKMLLMGVLSGIFLYGTEAYAQQEENLAQTLANPVASLISVPFQNNFDFNAGSADDGFRYTLNFQPVVPMTLNEDWNLINRLIVPFVAQNDVIGNSSQSGFGDAVYSAFLSPKESSTIWGVGPVFLLPIATDDLLGSEKFGIGPTAVVLKQQGLFTYGFLANHIWSVAGKSDRADVSATFLQPFFSKAYPTGFSWTINSESTQDWENEVFNGSAGVFVAQIVTVGSQRLSLGGGPRIFFGDAPGRPEWGIRINIILLFPKG